MEQKALSDIRRKLKILRHADKIGNISKTCRYFGVSREIFYRWKRAYEAKGEQALINHKPCPENLKRRTPLPVEEKVLYLRQTYHLGKQRISWYLARYHGISVSETAIYYMLKRHGLNRLPQHFRTRALPTFKRYEKQVPGHRIQVDVKFLHFIEEGQPIKRFQYTAIDDATRIRALKIYPKHTQANAIDFMNYVIDKFPFRIHTVQTDNGHEFQAKFHWHVEDLGMQHVYIKPATPRLNGKVERSHKTDQQEFYQLLEYRGDQDLSLKLTEWENFYNCHRPHGSFRGQTPYEILKIKLQQTTQKTQQLLESIQK